MIVGIISKEAHAKSHQKALEQDGHKVLLLGGGNPSVPPTVDVIVCRPASCSHQGFDVAMAHKRQGRKVIIANGVVEIVNSVKTLYSGLVEDDAAAPSSATSQANPPADKVEPVATLLEDLPVPAWITAMSERLGIYGALLHRASAEAAVTQLAGTGKDTRLIAAWKRYIKDRPQSYERIRTDIREDVVGGNKLWPLKVSCYYIPDRGGVREGHFVVTDASVVPATFKALDLFQSKVEAEAAFASRKKAAAPVAPVSPPATVLKPKPGPVPVHAPSTATVAALSVHLVPVAAPMAVPAAASAPAASVVEKAPLVDLPTTFVAPVPAQKAVAWDSSLRSAIALVLAEMKATRVTEISVKADGSVNFKREEVVIVVKDGSMTVGLED